MTKSVNGKIRCLGRVKSCDWATCNGKSSKKMWLPYITLPETNSKTASSPLIIGHPERKGKDRIPTIHFPRAIWCYTSPIPCGDWNTCLKSAEATQHDKQHEILSQFFLIYTIDTLSQLTSLDSAVVKSAFKFKIKFQCFGWVRLGRPPSQ